VSYLKLVTLWLLGTFIFFIFIATSMLFSRITTLEAVTVFEFKMYVKILENIEESKIENLMSVANVLAPSYTTKEGIKIDNNYFPIAIVTKDNCLENGIGNSNICTNFKNISDLENFAKGLNQKEYKKEKFYILKDDRTFIHRKINDELHLIGSTGKYLDREKRTFFEFIKNDWSSYFLTLDSGKSGLKGLWNTWNKSKESFYIIFSISIILLSIVILIQRRNRNRFNELKEQLNLETKKIEKLNEKYDELNSQKLELEEKVDNKDNEQKLIKLNSEIEKLRKEISESSKYEDLIFDKLKKQSNSLSNDLKSEELEKIITEMQTIKHLWTREFEWKNRLNLESNITTETTNIPFTLTIAFILFENQFIDKLARKSDYYEIAAINLEKKIDLVCKEHALSSDVKEKFHEIRKARNKWFHYGKKPSSSIINDLLSVLEQYDIKADILI
jgi:hypothetical protein